MTEKTVKPSKFTAALLIAAGILLFHPQMVLGLTDVPGENLAVSIPQKGWSELKGEHFIIYYKEDEHFARKALERAEKYYWEISEKLGFQRYENFWQWERRVKIYIYATKQHYLAETGEPKWSQGVADYTRKQIISYAWEKEFLDALLPHELAHLIFRDYVGFKGQIPLWLDEGVAQWQEPAKRKQVKEAMKSILKEKKEHPLEKFTQMDIRKKPEPEGEYAPRKSDEEEEKESKEEEAAVTAFYIQAMSVVSFLIEEYGSANFTIFCRQLRDGKRLNDALKFTYPTSIRDLNEMEEKWKRFALKN